MRWSGATPPRVQSTQLDLASRFTLFYRTADPGTRTDLDGCNPAAWEAHPAARPQAAGLVQSQGNSWPRAGSVRSVSDGSAVSVANASGSSSGSSSGSDKTSFEPALVLRKHSGHLIPFFPKPARDLFRREQLVQPQ